MFELAEILESLYNNESDVSETHLLEIEVLNYERREVESRHLVEKHIGTDRIAVEGQNKILRLVRIALERGGLTVGGKRSLGVAQAQIPDHSARVGRTGVGGTSGVEAAHDASRHIGHIRVGPFLKQLGQTLLEFTVILFGQI